MPSAAAVEGERVAFWDGRRLEFAVVRGAFKGRLELFTTAKKKLRLAPERLAHRWPPSDEPLAEWVDRLRAEASSIDVPILWSTARERGAAISTSTLARWWDEEGGPELAAIVDLALLEDAIHFARRRDAWEARERDAVERLREQREQEAEAAERRDRWLDTLRRVAAGKPVEVPEDPWALAELEAIERLAIEGDDSDAATLDRVRRWLDAAGERGAVPGSAAFRVALAFGRFDDPHENLDLRRAGLEAAFPEALERSAEAAARRGPEAVPTEEDWTDAETVTVDDPWTREVDDAIAWRDRREGGLSLAVLIADPTRFFERDDAIERAARERGQTVYLPDAKIPMLPASLGSGAASLQRGVERPAFAFVFELDADGAIVSSRATPVRARVERRLDYDEVDAGLAAGDAPWRRPFDALEALAAERARRSPPPIDLDEVEIRVEDGTVRIVRRPAGSRARRGVTEAMVRASERAAAILAEAGLPALYRGQEPAASTAGAAVPGAEDGEAPLAATAPGGAPPVAPYGDPRFGAAWVAARRRRMGLRRGTLGTAPAPHYGLGANAYAQATSPLRRAADLVNLRQLHAVVAGGEPLPQDAIDGWRADAAAGERRARRLERRRNRYWILETLRSRGEATHEAVVLDDAPSPRVGLAEFMFEAPIADVGDATLGETVEVAVSRVDPRGDLLKLRRASIRGR